MFRSVEGAKEFGIQASQPVVEFAISQDRKNQIVDQLHRGLTGLLKQRKVVVFAGVGRLLAGKVVEVTGRDGFADDLAGEPTSCWLRARSREPSPASRSTAVYVLTSDELLDLRRLPRSVAVIGGGAIGCEFASMLADLGVQGHAPRGLGEDPARL